MSDSPKIETSEKTLNQVVKGAPPPGTKVPPPAPLPPLTDTAVVSEEPKSYTKPSKRQKPLPVIHTDSLPSSPPQIYLNLLILESSLRQQYLALLSRRRLNTFFLSLLLIWNIGFTYALFFRPREDVGYGGSPYWVVEACIRLSFIAGLLTAFLIWATGQYEKGIRWPRKWLSTTNRGLRGFNLRVVIVHKPLLQELVSYVSALLGEDGDWHLVESPPTPADLELGRGGMIVEEDLSFGGDQLLLLVMPKNFSSEFREGWENYRSEYWESENKRREKLRGKVREHRREKARTMGGWKWWTGLWRFIPQPVRKHKPERRGSMLDKDKARRQSLLRDGGHSRGSSRSSTPAYLDGTLEIKTDRVRRGSSVSSTGSIRKTLRSGSVKRESMLSPLTMTDDGVKKERKRRSRPGTPTMSSSESITEVKVEPQD